MARLAVVSGGGTGIGWAVARRLAADGDRVVILGRRPGPLKATADTINHELGGDLVGWHTADLTDPGDLAGVVGAVDRAGGTVDVLVNNAGGRFGDDGTDLAAVAAGWSRDFQGNVLPTVLLTEALFDRLRRPGARIVALGSVAAFRPTGSYGAAKAALHAWVYTAATRLAPAGVTVNAVAPGFIPDTEFFGGGLTPEFILSRVDLTPVGRPGTPDEVAAAVRYLAAPEAGFTTGQILQVNGGMVFGRG
ncbi:SDR family NAD(P)-dependent oxidoreductase [Micromonospora sp. LOL_024]|uniref:SDR family NAD(P)-dependent oxidoreductase n=1 Tax=Micromonospora sp. LOL_024 TaxID=3345412 RepID=UPI003A8A19CB